MGGVQSAALAQHLTTTCNSVFRKLRRTRKAVKKHTQAAAEAKAAAASPTSPASPTALRDEVSQETGERREK